MLDIPAPLLTQVRTELTADEGERKKPYDDSTGKAPVLGRWTVDGHFVPTNGKLTIGVGCNLTDNDLPGHILDALFRHHVDVSYATARRMFPAFDTWTQNRQAAAVNLAFNLGEERFRDFTNTTRAMRDGRWNDAADGLVHSLWYTQVQKSRRDRIVRQVREG